jgi:hypothetical protein
MAAYQDDSHRFHMYCPQQWQATIIRILKEPVTFPHTTGFTTFSPSM